MTKNTIAGSEPVCKLHLHIDIMPTSWQVCMDKASALVSAATARTFIEDRWAHPLSRFGICFYKVISAKCRPTIALATQPENQ